MTLKFYLKDPNAKIETPIFISVYYQGRSLKVSTGERIHPKDWNQKKARARSSMLPPLQREYLNNRLRDMETRGKKMLGKLLAAEDGPTLDQMHGSLRELVKPERKEKEDLLAFIEEFIEAVETQRAKETIKAYRNSQKHLEAFTSENHLKPLVRDVDLDFYDQFVRYLTRKNFSQNTIGKQIKQLKVFVNEARERGIRTSEEIRSRRFKVLSEDRDHVYLTSGELDKMWEKDFSEQPRLDKVRDLFLVGCYTGLRFSDLSELSQDNIFDSQYFKLRTRKTDQLVIIPIHSRVRDILKKYNGKLPPSISNQKLNDYISEVAKAIELTTPVVTSITKGGSRENEVLPKYKLITSHTARRSFATNAFKAGIPSISIMKITGHRTEKAFMRYIHISEEENANQLASHAFFSDSK